MSPEKETFHVVIRIPTKRPEGFVEPPSIVWTDEMEHKLWQYMSQKNTDWNVIAEQLGVPTSYIVRHAAFIYETQLRGIHQQLRLNVNNSTMTRASAKSPTPSLKKPISSRYSNNFQQQQYLQDTEAQKQPDSRNNNNNTLLNSRNSTDTVQQNLITSHDPSTALPLKTQKSLSESLYKSSMGRLHTETTAYIKEDSEDEDRSLDNNNDDDDEEDDGTDTKEDTEEDEEERFSSHFERMKLQVEEPAFLARRLEGSAGSLSASRNQLSLSIQNLRKPSNVFGGESSIGSPKKNLSPQIHSPATTRPSTAPGSNNESAINSSTSSFSDISETSVTQSAMEDAFLSNFDHASSSSKISSFMSFTRK